MSRLIREEDVKREIDKWLDTVGEATIGKNRGYYGELLGCIEDAPTIEAVEVVHGKWVKDGDFLICLNCEAEINIKNSLGIENHKNFCPNCGADMRKGGANQ